MSTINIGNVLYRMVSAAKGALFDQGELAQLNYGAFDVVANNLSAAENEAIEVSFPVGYRPDRTPITSTRAYRKEDLLRRYQYLAFHQLPLNCLVQLVTIVEALLSDIVRAVVARYPQKLGAKRTVSLQLVLEATTLEDVHFRATDALLNDLSYKSPVEFAESLSSLLSLNLLECPAFHKYVELKACRDIYIHNRGVVNDTYLRKAGSHARAKLGHSLPIDIPYFLESYEACLQLTEWLENQLHERWHSSELEESQAKPTLQQPEPVAGLAVPLAEVSGLSSEGAPIVKRIPRKRASKKPAT